MKPGPKSGAKLPGRPRNVDLGKPAPQTPAEKMRALRARKKKQKEEHDANG